jgi:hypothetical protein
MSKVESSRRYSIADNLDSVNKDQRDLEDLKEESNQQNEFEQNEISKSLTERKKTGRNNDEVPELISLSRNVRSKSDKKANLKEGQIFDHRELISLGEDFLLDSTGDPSENLYDLSDKVCESEGSSKSGNSVRQSAFGLRNSNARNEAADLILHSA